MHANGEPRHIFDVQHRSYLCKSFETWYLLAVTWRLQAISSEIDERLFNELNSGVTTWMPAVRRKHGPERPGQGLGLQVRADPTVVQYTCSGCDLSFNSKRAYDGHRTSKYVSPMCRNGFLGGQRLSLTVTARDFRVSGRHSRERANDEGDTVVTY
jgi:hypothetical protein